MKLYPSRKYVALQYIHIEYKALVKLKPRKNEALAKFDIR